MGGLKLSVHVILNEEKFQPGLREGACVGSPEARGWSAKDCLWASGLGVEVARLSPGIPTGLVMLEFMGGGGMEKTYLA